MIRKNFTDGYENLRKKDDFNFNIEGKSILDLGCGFPTEYFSLFHNDRFKSYLGVEQLKENELNDPPRKIYELYESFVEPRNEEKLLSEEQFGTIFKFKWGTDIHDYLKNFDEKFDCIILSNILHFLSIEHDWIFDQSLKRLSIKGLIYVRVNSASLITADKKLINYRALMNKINVIWKDINSKWIQFIGTPK